MGGRTKSGGVVSYDFGRLNLCVSRLSISAVFRAVHQRSQAERFWQLDERFLGKTRHFHEQAIIAESGWHTLTLVDDQGFRLRHRFKVLGK